MVSTRVRCGRSMEGYPFNPWLDRKLFYYYFLLIYLIYFSLTEAQYKEMEEKVSSTLSGLEGELKGKFYPLTGMDKATQQQLIDDHFLFKEGDRFLQAANACRFWPSGRGIYHNDAKTFLVWVNDFFILKAYFFLTLLLFSAMKKIICALSQCKWVAILEKFFVV